MYLLFGPSSQDLLSEILFVIIAQIICCIWHCWHYVAFGTGTVGIMLHLALLTVAFGPVVMLHLALLALCCVDTVGIMLHLELLTLCCIRH